MFNESYSGDDLNKADSNKIDSGKIFETPREKLKQQFAKTEEISLNNGQRIHVFDISLADKDAKDQKGDAPIFYFKGMLGLAKPQEDFMIELAVLKQRVIATNDRFGINLSLLPESKRLQKAKELLSISDVELERVAAVAVAIKTKNIPKVTLVSQSGGSEEITFFALLYPELVENMIYISPAGLIGKDSMPRLVRGFMENTKTQKEITNKKLQGIDPYDSPPGRDTDLREVDRRESELVKEGELESRISKKATI
jgi:pimeloyl-ACP methyl ester carboxylesterase